MSEQREPALEGVAELGPAFGGLGVELRRPLGLAASLRELCACGKRFVAVARDELGAAFEQPPPELELASTRADAQRVRQLVRSPTRVVARRLLELVDQLDGAADVAAGEANECGDRECRDEHLPVTALPSIPAR